MSRRSGRRGKKLPGTGDPVGEKFIAGHLPYSLVGRLALFALYHETPRTRLIGELVAERIQTGPSPEEMIKGIAHRFFAGWEALRDGGSRKTWAAFVKETRAALARKKLPPTYVSEVISVLEAVKKETG